MVMMYIRSPLSLRNVDDLLHEGGIDICHQTLRFWRHRFGPRFAGEIRKRRVEGLRIYAGNRDARTTISQTVAIMRGR